MQINLTKRQYRDLLLSVIIGVYIREAIDDSEGKDCKTLRDLEQYLYSFAKDFDAEDMVQRLVDGFYLPSDDIIEEYHEHYIESFQEDSFWDELVTALGKRDFEKFSTKREREVVKSQDGYLFGVIDKYYQRYEEEFEKNGVERLVIDDRE